MAADILTKHFLHGEKWIGVCSLIGVAEPEYKQNTFVFLQHLFAKAEGAQVVRPTFRVPRAMASPPTPSMGPDAIQRATARSSAAPASMTRACLTSVHQFFCPAAVHIAKAAWGIRRAKASWEAVTAHYFEKWQLGTPPTNALRQQTWRLRKQSRGVQAWSSQQKWAAAELGLRRSTKNPDAALGIPRDLLVGIYSDSSLVATNRMFGKNAKNGQRRSPTSR